MGGTAPTVSANENVLFNDGLGQAGIPHRRATTEVWGYPIQIAALAKDQATFEAGNILLGGAGSERSPARRRRHPRRRPLAERPYQHQGPIRRTQPGDRDRRQPEHVFAAE